MAQWPFGVFMGVKNSPLSQGGLVQGQERTSSGVDHAKIWRKGCCRGQVY